MTISEWFFKTKLGHFIFVFTLSIFAALLICYLFPRMSFSAILLGAFLVSFYKSITDHNKRWY